MNKAENFSEQNIDKDEKKYVVIKWTIVFVMSVSTVACVFLHKEQLWLISFAFLFLSFVSMFVLHSIIARNFKCKVSLLKNKAQELECNLNERNAMLRKRALSGILNGNMPDEIHEFLPEFKKNICVLHILYNKEHSKDSEKIQKIAEEIFSELADLSFPENDIPGHLSIVAELFSYDDSSWMEIEKTATKFVHKLKNLKNISADVIYGKVCKKADELFKSYKNIKEAALICHRDGCVIDAEKVAARDYNVYNYSVDDEIAIIIYIKKGDFSRAYGLMRNALDEVLYQHSYPIDIIKCFMFEMAGTILKAIGETEKENGVKLNCSKNLKGIFYLDTVNEMELVLKEYLKAVCALIAESNKGVVSPFCEKIKKYVKENYSDLDMNVNAIAARFYINPAYLSNMFKRNTDIKLLDYINKVRIDEAKKLIMATPDIPIEELSEKSGFKNSRTFRRIFMKYENVSPSKFAKN